MAGLSVKGEETLVLTQSAIGEIYRLTIKISGQGRIFAAERPKARCESDLSQEPARFVKLQASLRGSPIASQNARYQPV